MENLREAKLSPSQLLEKLAQWEARKLDLIVPSRQLIMQPDPDEKLRLGIATRPGLFVPTRTMHGQIAEKLGIPFRYYQKCMDTLPDLASENVNKWLENNDLNYLIRSYDAAEEGGMGIGRAFLSDKYKIIDNTPILQTVLQAVMDSNIKINVESCDLSEKRMVVRFFAPEVMENAQDFVAKYRNPETGEKDDGVIAGFVLSNSEVGYGSMTLAPRVVLNACSNGLIFMNKAVKKIHVGIRQDEGEVEWSAQTLKKNLELIMSASKDYVKDFCSNKYLQKLIAEVTEKAREQLLYPIEATQNMCKEFDMTQEQSDSVLNFFINSGDTTRGGAINAATFFAHKQDDPDLRFDIESKAVSVLDKFASLDAK